MSKPKENIVILGYKQWPPDLETYQRVLLNGADITDKLSHMDIHLGEDMAEEFNRRNLFDDKPVFRESCAMLYFKAGPGENFMVFCHKICFEKIKGKRGKK